MTHAPDRRLDQRLDRRLDRRTFLAAAAALALAPRKSVAVEGENATRAPALFVYHGSPLIAVDAARAAELSAWGNALRTANVNVKGIVAVTPHVRAADAIEIGWTGAGVALDSYPRRFREQLAQLDYRSPPSESLALRVESSLASAKLPFRRGDARGQNHTVWAPLLHLFPDHDAPVVELAMPFVDDAGFFALGAALAPLRSEGVVVLASGTATHNLALLEPRALASAAPPPPPEAFAVEFDQWLRESVAHKEIDALLDWRKRAPAADLAHPDDGGHYRVLLVAAGTGFARASFPIEGFEMGSFSKRGIQLD